MRSDLYQDLYELEGTHWWHIAKRRHALNLIRRHLPASKLRILDLGCGTGKNIEFFSSLGHVSGLDSSPYAIKFCRRRRLKSAILGDCLHTPYESSSFDLITLFDVLEHVPQKATVREIYRLLKPGGWLLITVPAYSFLWSRWDDILGHRRRYTHSSLSAVLNRFHIQKSSYLFSFLLPPALIVRPIKSLLYRHRSYPSDFKLSSPLTNRLFLSLSLLEGHILKYATIPFGTSIICLARKPD